MWGAEGPEGSIIVTELSLEKQTFSMARDITWGRRGMGDPMMVTATPHMRDHMMEAATSYGRSHDGGCYIYIIWEIT